MKRIKIKIPHNLKPKEEVKFIAERLTQKMLAGNGNQLDKVRLGDQIDVQHLNTVIEIERTGEAPIEMVNCTACNCEYQNNMFFPVYVNYGGKTKLLKYCSEVCQQTVINICGEGRAAKSKSKLTQFKYY